MKDAILLKEFDSEVLSILTTIALTEEREDRPLFPNLLEEPTLYRSFRRWVSEGFAEQEKLQQIRKDLTSSMGRAG